MDKDKELIRRQHRKIMFIQVSATMFLELLKTGEHHFLVEKGLPKDAKFEYAGHTEWGTLNVIFSSDVFSLVGEGDIIPEFQPPEISRLRQVTDETRQRFIHLAGSYMSHEDKDVRNIAIMLRTLLEVK